jgi:hypothetical protein
MIKKLLFLVFLGLISTHLLGQTYTQSSIAINFETPVNEVTTASADDAALLSSFFATILRK